MKKPTHAEIAERAHRIWQDAGANAREARENWLEAERQLSSSTPESPADTPSPEPAPRRTLGESNRPEAEAERAAQQRKEARAPQVATHTGPKPLTPTTGKPLWNQPHSS